MRRELKKITKRMNAIQEVCDKCITPFGACSKCTLGKEYLELFDKAEIIEKEILRA